MEAQSGGATRQSCPFADVRPEGCICIALADNKRISVDYQSRFCFTENHVRCRRFQRAVPEIPNGETAAVGTWIDDPRLITAVAIVSVLLFFAIILTAFHGTWTGWFTGNGESTATAQAANGEIASPTAIVLGGSQGSSTASATATNGTEVPILIVTPTPQVSTTPSAPTPVATSTPGAATQVPATTPASTPPSTPVPTPQSGGPTSSSPPVASGGPSSSSIPPASSASSGQSASGGYVAPSTSYPVSVSVAPTPAVHTVQPGETINSIGARYGVPTVLIAVANDLTNADLIQPGDQLFIPTPDGHLPPEAPLAGVHLVVAGDALSTIAEEFDVSVETLMNYNGITNPDLIQTGYIILVSKAATLASTAGQTTDVVQAGDTLFSIAQRFGVTVDAIMQANGLTDRNLVQVGQLLVIPVA